MLSYTVQLSHVWGSCYLPGLYLASVAQVLLIHGVHRSTHRCCHVSGMLHRRHLKSPLLTVLQHQYTQHFLPTTPISLPTPILGTNFYKDNVEAFLLYTCYPSKSFICTTKHFHSSTMLINAFF